MATALNFGVEGPCSILASVMETVPLVNGQDTLLTTDFFKIYLFTASNTTGSQVVFFQFFLDGVIVAKQYVTDNGILLSAKKLRTRDDHMGHLYST